MDKLRQVIFIALCFTLVMASCQKVKNREIRSAHADSVLFDAGAVMNYARMEVLIDSFAKTGDINEMNVNRWRGVLAYHQKQFTASEKYYR